MKTECETKMIETQSSVILEKDFIEKHNSTMKKN